MAGSTGTLSDGFRELGVLGPGASGLKATFACAPKVSPVSSVCSSPLVRTW